MKVIKKEKDMQPDQSLEDPVEITDEAEDTWDEVYAEHGVEKINLSLEEEAVPAKKSWIDALSNAISTRLLKRKPQISKGKNTKIYIGEVINGKTKEIGYYSTTGSTIPQHLVQAINTAINKGKLTLVTGGTGPNGEQYTEIKTITPDKDFAQFITVYLIDHYSREVDYENIYRVTRMEIETGEK